MTGSGWIACKGHQRIRGVGSLWLHPAIAVLTVANVVRLVYAKRRADIARSAPAGHIRGPFVMEGVLQGGSAGAWQASFDTAIRARYLVPLARRPPSIRFLPLTSARSGVGGMLVGCRRAGCRWNH
jgi:cell division protein FtsX